MESWVCKAISQLKHWLSTSVNQPQTLAVDALSRYYRVDIPCGYGISCWTICIFWILFKRKCRSEQQTLFLWSSPLVSTAVRNICQKPMIIWNEYYKPRSRGNIPSDQATGTVGEHCNCRWMAGELGRSTWAEMKERKRENPYTVVVTQHTKTLQNRQRESWAKPGTFSAKERLLWNKGWQL